MGGRSVAKVGESTERMAGPHGQEVVIEWFKKGRGPFGIDRRVARTRGATHARVTQNSATGAPVRQWIELAAKVDTIVAEVSVAWSKNVSSNSVIADATNFPEKRPAGIGPRPVRSRCPYCDQARVSRGAQSFVQHMKISANLSFDERKARYLVFACPQCGSVELFEPVVG